MSTTDRITAPPLTAAQGGLAAQWLKLARLIPRPFSARYPNAADQFESDAILALCLAARDYDPAHALGLKFSTYARKRITWAMLELERKLWVAWRRESGPAAEVERLDRSPGPLEQLEAAEAGAGRVERAMGLIAGLRLNRHRRMAALLYLEGLPIEAAAARMGLPVESAQTYQYQAHRLIRERLAGEAEGQAEAA